MANTIDLPKEIWLEIVSYLDYSALKKIMRVSKAFKSYVELPTCQKKMFRSKAVVPKGGPINLDNVVLHPAFERMAYECATELDGVFFFNYSNYNEEPTVLTDTCAADEHATDPPVAFLLIQITNWPAVQVTNDEGVTVLQVMKALCRFFATGRHRESRGDLPDGLAGIRKSSIATAISCSGPTTLIHDGPSENDDNVLLLYL